MMVLAVPMNTQGRVSGHLGKAPHLLVLDDHEARRIDNPMDAGTCSGRCKLLEALEQAGVTHLLVRQIGQRTLGRFLRAGLKVYRLPRGMTARPERGDIPEGAEELVAAAQGRPSRPRADHQHGGCGA
ncbi:NifB/NifX family molybdenum-iron cluster-binding protein [Halomonas sp. C05BenzN]|uniref:NifB/NifX family molybdenum-iron cluster-binding protein n=1 Tax=Halomonas sp. C05BenzN TaxID=3411041 RepID=UPI003B9581A7